MKKLTLKLDALKVDSFPTSQYESWAGTVHGEQDNVTAGGDTKCGGIHTCGAGCMPTAGGETKCGGIQTCGAGCGGQVTAGGATQCGGIQTCGQGCQPQITAGGPTNCGGIQTCGEGCKQ